MPLRISGFFIIQTPDKASLYTKCVVERIISLLRQEDIRTIEIRNGATLIYTRGYPVWMYSKSYLALFDPGEISIYGDKNELLIKYHFGLEPLYVPTTLFGLSLISLYSISENYAHFLYITALLCFLLACCVGGSVFNAHIWLKKEIVSVLHKEIFE